ncbi:hypothetical protein COHA_000215 [Chlorella ohadii]|uniref:SBP-type domain-containing protein n=1 Tax=Chlorella ohadii TaxID=2649997 RepID=A0AAD5DXK4_9CHLO|nr:hypothetical protein COHA_000215 [Chlorella ohadii]
MTIAASSVSSASAVQARTPRRPVGCQVPCCGADEQSMPDYNKRVHVCEVHAKAPIVRGAHGNLLRFCQQCSKLQPLVEFKGQQRSCMAAQAKPAHAGQAAQLAPQQLGWAAAPPLPPLKDLLARMPLLPEQPLPAPPSMAVGAALAPAAPRVLPWSVPLLPPPPLLPRGVPLPLPWAVPPPPPALEPLGVPLPPLPPLRDLPLGPLEQLHHEDELDLSILLTGEPDALVDMLQEFDDVLMDYLVAQPAALPIAQPPPPAQPAQHSTDSSADRFSAFDR